MNAQRLKGIGIRRRLGALLVAAGLAGLSACGGAWDQPLGDAAVVVEPTAEPTTGPTPADCDNAGDPASGLPPAVASYPPSEIPSGSPPAFPAGSAMADIQARGRLIVGTSPGTLLFASVNPVTGIIEGFDVDMARLVAGAIFGLDPDSAELDQHLELVAITSAQRIPKLEAHEVDLVALTMTINCARWQRVAFSTVYYNSGQTVLVRSGSTFQSIDDFADQTEQKVCAHAGSTSLVAIRSRLPAEAVVEVPELTDCLVAFEQGDVDAISTDDTILAGFAAQDPYAEIVATPAFTEEPYGLAMPLDQPELTQFVNAVLERAFTDGTWQARYDRWLADLAPQSTPATNYDRPLPGNG